MTATRRRALKTDEETAAKIYAEEIVPLMENVRLAVDRLEYLVEDKSWPLPKYRELMFLR